MKINYILKQAVELYHSYQSKTRWGFLPDLKGIDNIEEMRNQLKFDPDFEKRCGSLISRNLIYYPDHNNSQITIHSITNEEKCIGFTGGINNTPNDHLENVKILSSYGGHVPIHSTYNATHGIFRDLIEAGMGLNLVCTTPATLSAKRKLHFFKNAPEDALYLQIAHSQGAIHEVLSQLILPEEYRNRVIFMGIAPAVYMPSKLCKVAFHYQSTRDFVPHLQKVIGKINNTASNIYSLSPDQDAPLFDHSLSSLTYKPIIGANIDKYLRNDYNFVHVFEATYSNNNDETALCNIICWFHENYPQSEVNEQ